MSLRINNLRSFPNNIAPAQVQFREVYCGTPIWKSNRRFIYLWKVRQKFESQKGSHDCAFTACTLLSHQTIRQFVPKNRKTHFIPVAAESSILLHRRCGPQNSRQSPIWTLWVDHSPGDAKLGPLHCVCAKRRPMVSLQWRKHRTGLRKESTESRSLSALLQIGQVLTDWLNKRVRTNLLWI